MEIFFKIINFILEDGIQRKDLTLTVINIIGQLLITIITFGGSLLIFYKSLEKQQKMSEENVNNAYNQMIIQSKLNYKKDYIVDLLRECRQYYKDINKLKSSVIKEKSYLKVNALENIHRWYLDEFLIETSRIHAGIMEIINFLDSDRTVYNKILDEYVEINETYCEISGQRDKYELEYTNIFEYVKEFEDYIGELIVSMVKDIKD